VKEVAPAKRSDELVAHPEARREQIARHRDHAPGCAGAPAAHELVESLARTLADENVNWTLSAQQEFDEVASDETGGAGHEIRHGIPSERSVTRSPWLLRATLRAGRADFKRVSTAPRLEVEQHAIRALRAFHLK
jgi:hypothetical protein